MLLKDILSTLEPYQTVAAMALRDTDIKSNIYRTLEGNYICVFWSFNDNFKTEAYKAETVNDILNKVGEWSKYHWCLINKWA